MMAATEATSFSHWWVFVKHSDGLEEFAQVKQFLDWNPKSETDFKSSEKYLLRTNKWNPEKDFERIKAHVIRMAETMDELKLSLKQKRPVFPRLEPRDSDYISDEPRDEHINGPKNKRAKQADVASKKLRAEEKDFKSFLGEMQIAVPPSTSSSIQHRTLPESVVTGSSLKKKPPTKTSESSRTFTNPKSPQPPSVNPTCTTSTNSTVAESARPPNPLTNLNKHSSSDRHFENPSDVPSNYSDLVQGMKQKDNELEKLRAELKAAKSKLKQNDELVAELRTVTERVTKFEENMTNRMNLVETNLSDRIASVEEIVTKMSDRSFSGSRTTTTLDVHPPPNVVINGDTVDLGEGVECTLASYTTFSTTSDLTLWATAMVLGVFKDEAKNYRLMPRGDDKIKFPENFKTIAKVHYMHYLRRQGHRPPFSKKTVNSILGVLSSRCHDQSGRRNTGTGRPKVGNRDQNGAIEEEYTVDPESGLLRDARGRPLVVTPIVAHERQSDESEEEDDQNSDA